jgi:hypothetical protein
MLNRKDAQGDEPPTRFVCKAGDERRSDMRLGLPVAAAAALVALAGCATYDDSAYYYPPAPAYVPVATTYQAYTVPAYTTVPAPAYVVPAVPAYRYAYERPWEWRGGVPPQRTSPDGVGGN